MNITLRNDFHGTEATFRTMRVVSGVAVLSAAQHRRAQRKLCGATGCTCGLVRGPQPALPEGVRDYIWSDAR